MSVNISVDEAGEEEVVLLEIGEIVDCGCDVYVPLGEAVRVEVVFLVTNVEVGG